MVSLTVDDQPRSNMDTVSEQTGSLDHKILDPPSSHGFHTNTGYIYSSLTLGCSLSNRILLIVRQKCTLAASDVRCTLVSHGKYADETDRQTDGQTPDRYITLPARRGQRYKLVNVRDFSPKKSRQKSSNKLATLFFITINVFL